MPIENLNNLYRMPAQNRSAGIYYRLDTIPSRRILQHTLPRLDNVIYPFNSIPSDYNPDRVGSYNPLELKFSSDPEEDTKVKGLMAELFDGCSRYMDYDELAKIDTAMALMHYGHQNQKRDSGDPYSTHLLKVTLPLVQKYQMDWETIASALCHDLLEDSDMNGYPVTKKDLEKFLSSNVAETVDILSKVRFESLVREEYVDKITRAELLKSLHYNPRVAVIKTYDRIHNLETIISVPDPISREQKALETLRYYVPLANFLGLYDEAQKLARLALDVTEPELVMKIEKVQEDFTALVSEVNPETGMSYLDEVRDRIANVLGRNPKNIKLYISDIFSVYNNLFGAKTPDTSHCFLRVDLEFNSKEKWLDYAWLARLHLSADKSKDFDMEESINLESVREKILSNRLNSLEFYMRTNFALRSRLKFNFYPQGGIKIAQTPITDLYYHEAAGSQNEKDKQTKIRHLNSLRKWEQITLNLGTDIDEMETSEISQRLDRLDPNKKEIIEKSADDKLRTWYIDSGSTVLDFIVYKLYDSETGSVLPLLKIESIKVNGQLVTPDYMLKPRDEISYTLSDSVIFKLRWIRALKTSPDEVKEHFKIYFRERLLGPDAEKVKNDLFDEAIRLLSSQMKQELLVPIERSELVRKLNKGDQLMYDIALDEINDEVLDDISQELADYQRANVRVLNLFFLGDSKGLDSKVSGMISGKGINFFRHIASGPVIKGGHAKLIYVIDLGDPLNQGINDEEIKKIFGIVIKKLVKNRKLYFSRGAIEDFSQLNSYTIFFRETERFTAGSGSAAAF